MNRIELADGTTFEGNAGYTGPTVGLFVDVATVQKQLPNLIDSQKIDPITYYYGVYKDIYHGFTKLDRIDYNESTQTATAVLFGENTHAEFKIPTVPEEYLPK